MLQWRLQVDKKVVESIFEDGGNGSTQQSAAGSIDGVQAPPSAPGAARHRALNTEQMKLFGTKAALLTARRVLFSSLL